MLVSSEALAARAAVETTPKSAPCVYIVRARDNSRRYQVRVSLQLQYPKQQNSCTLEIEIQNNEHQFGSTFFSYLCLNFSSNAANLFEIQ